MFNARGLALFVFLALTGALTSLTELNARGLGRRIKESEVQPGAPEVQAYFPTHAVRPLPTLQIKGSVYETDGTLLKSVVVNITVTDNTQPTPIQIGSSASSMATGTYPAVTWTGNPLADGIIFVTYKRVGGTGSLTFPLSSLPAAIENISPIVPK